MIKIFKCLLIVMLSVFSISCSSNQVRYTKMIEECVSKEEMAILNTLFLNFVQKMNVEYGCKDADAALRYLASNFTPITESETKLFSSDAEEKKLINQYASMPTFKKSWSIIYEDEPSREYFPLFNCSNLKISDTDVKQILYALSLAGDYSVYMMEPAFSRLIKTNKKISDDLGFFIFSFLYIAQLFNHNLLN